MTEQPPLDGAEARRILEELPRTGPPSAKVNSIRLLLRLDLEKAQEGDDEELEDWKRTWGPLYGPDDLEWMQRQSKARKKKGEKG